MIEMTNIRGGLIDTAAEYHSLATGSPRIGCTSSIQPAHILENRSTYVKDVLILFFGMLHTNYVRVTYRINRLNLIIHTQKAILKQAAGAQTA